MAMSCKFVERAYTQFAKDDNSDAEGYVHPYEYDKDGQKITGEDFGARKLVYNVAGSTHTADHTRSTGTGPGTPSKPAPDTHTRGRWRTNRTRPLRAPASHPKKDS